MLRCLKRIYAHYKARSGAESGKTAEAEAEGFGALSASLGENLQRLRARLGESSDIVFREFRFGPDRQWEGALLFVDGLTNKDLIDLGVLQPLMYESGSIRKIPGGRPDLKFIAQNLLSSSDAGMINTIEAAIEDALAGNTVLLCDGVGEALSISARSWEKRAIAEPATENVVRGPREGFTETLRTNTALIRRKIKNPNLRFESVKVGVQTRTDVSIAYIEGIVKPGLVDEIKSRLAQVQTDSVLDSGYIEAFIEDAPYSIFPTVGNSERPDTIAGKLLEGRAALIVDGSPMVLTVPMLLIESFQTAEDYYLRTYYASMLRVIRLFCYLVTVLAPAAYVALTTYHQELIPTQLLFTMAAGHQGIPFPSLVEALLMVVMFDILREAGVRLPKPIGSTVSIVGALVLGESAVSAGLIGPFMVIVVAITAITSFVVPSQTDSVSVMRYFFLLVAGFMGGFGIIMGSLLVGLHLVSLYSFGVPYLSPLAPSSTSGLKDTFVRFPLLSMTLRPDAMGRANPVRRKPRSEDLGTPPADAEKKQ